MQSYEETSDQIAKLYESDFNGKKKGRFRIARTTLAILAGRRNIEQTSVNQIQLFLSEKHDLQMIDMYDEFAIIKSSILRRYRKATNNVVEDLLGIFHGIDEIEDDE